MVAYRASNQEFSFIAQKLRRKSISFSRYRFDRERINNGGSLLLETLPSASSVRISFNERNIFLDTDGAILRKNRGEKTRRFFRGYLFESSFGRRFPIGGEKGQRMLSFLKLKFPGSNCLVAKSPARLTTLAPISANNVR